MYAISVIIPCFNAQTHLPACLASIRVQRMDAVEYIFIDDGSSDATAQMLDDFAASFKQSRVLHQKNAGVSAARNRGIEIARGKYIAFLDADDAYEEEALTRLYQTAEKTGADITSADHTIFYEKNQLRVPVKQQPAPASAQDVVEMIIGMHRIYNNLWNKLYRRELFDRESMRLDEGIRIGEDAALNLRLYLCAKRIAHLPERTYVYRVHEKSAMASVPGGYAKAHAAMLESMALTLSQWGVKEKYFDLFLYSAMWIHEKEKGVMRAAREFDDFVHPLVSGGVQPDKLDGAGKRLYRLIGAGAFPAYYIARHAVRKLMKKRGNQR